MVDYTDVYAPVALATTLRTILALATHLGLKMYQYDIKLAFISADIDRPVYMKSPVGSGEPRGSVWFLKRCLYGLAQSPRLFNAKLHRVLLSLDWRQSSHDACLYYQRSESEVSFLIVVVERAVRSYNH